MRVITISCDGIFQAAERGLFEWLAEQEAEIICLQDLRASTPEVEDGPQFQLDGYFSYVFDAADSTQNGVAIYTRHAPKAMMYGFGLQSGEDMDGRYLQADFDELSVVSLIVPHGPEGSEQLEAKSRFVTGLQSHLEKITRKRRRYIFCGSWYMAATDGDVEHGDAHDGEPGLLPAERQWFRQVYKNIGYADAFRASNTDTDEFSWWPSGTMGEGDGWRIDTQVISGSLVPKVEYAVIYKARKFSSHAPVIVDYEIAEY